MTKRKTKPRKAPRTIAGITKLVDAAAKRVAANQKRKTKPDPMKALRKEHPTPWRETMVQRCYRYYYVHDANGILLADCCSEQIARAICRMGNGK